MSQPLTTPPPQTWTQIRLLPQTGMPEIYSYRSKELSMKYDALQNEITFKFNKFGPQQLNLTRPGAHW